MIREAATHIGVKRYENSQSHAQAANCKITAASKVATLLIVFTWVVKYYRFGLYGIAIAQLDGYTDQL